MYKPAGILKNTGAHLEKERLEQQQRVEAEELRRVHEEEDKVLAANRLKLEKEH